MFSFLCLSFMEWNKIGLMISLSRFQTYVNITTSTDCYLVPGSIVTTLPTRWHQSSQLDPHRSSFRLKCDHISTPE